jgi:hypothetical protein
MQTLELNDGGILHFDEVFLPPDIADRCLTE